ncbi:MULTISPECIES: OmpA family protein [Chitinophagaceae]
MKKNNWCLVALTAIILGSVSCVPKKRLLDSQIAYRYLQGDSARMANKISEQDNEIARLNSQVNQLNKKIEELNHENDNLAKDANSTQSQLDENRRALLSQQAKAKQLQDLLDSQKSKSRELRQKMADALKGFSSDQLTVTQKNGKVYVSMQESLLFPSGSAVLNQQGIDALGKLATVLNQNPEINIDVEGHTDSVPIRIKFKDNWQLSTERALSIVRVLLNNYHVNPNNLIASGHSEYDPVASNSTPEGRAQNRRTEIVLTPNLDEMYKLLE